MTAKIIKSTIEEVGQEIQKNINQGDGHILVSVTNNTRENSANIRVAFHNEEMIVSGLKTQAFSQTSPDHTINKIKQIVKILSRSEKEIVTETERRSKLN